MVHHHRKGEMEHHRAREAARNVHQSKMAGEHNLNQSMTEKNHGIPSKAMTKKESIVKDNHQQGIERVMQRKGDMEIGQHGKMLVHSWHSDSKGHEYKNSK
jgi:hypothetical protein